MANWAAMVAMREPDRVWARRLVDKFPRTWMAKILARYQRDHKADYREANLSLLHRVRKLSDAARGGIAPDAGDAEICTQADNTARDFARRLRHVEAIAKGEAMAERGASRRTIPGDVAPKDGGHMASRYFFWGDAWVLRVKAFFARALLKARGLLDLWPEGATVTRAGAVKRMECPKWWRRAYRKLHARTVEACGIGLGLVSRVAGLYASDEAVKRRKAQNARNAGVLASVRAINEAGQDYSLAELAAKGTANKEIRRVELLTRIAGFELIAKECGHIAYMVTVTCPSRFHKMTTRGDGRVVENPKYDGSTPNEAQKYLSGQWAKCRAAAARAGLDWYGFRIAEPQHDATPHWHVLLFMPERVGVGAGSAERVAHSDGRPACRALVSLVRRYFWRNESPSEPGAKKHRCDFERIDWAKGSAVGYVIKYISKNIDGHGVGQDLFGNDAITSSQRVEAWASTWRIRQFQQLGGAPVTVWRELRRLSPDNCGDGAPDSLAAALSAINVGKIEPGIQALAWKKYIAAQGGIGTPRAAQSIRLVREQTGECGRYGEAVGPRPIGIEANGRQFFRSHLSELVGDLKLSRPATSVVESERMQWITVPGGVAGMAAARAEVQRIGEAERTRIHVNNCTPPTVADGLRIVSMRQLSGGDYMPECVGAFLPVHEYRRKLGRPKNWSTSHEKSADLSG